MRKTAGREPGGTRVGGRHNQLQRDLTITGSVKKEKKKRRITLQPWIPNFTISGRWQAPFKKALISNFPSPRTSQSPPQYLSQSIQPYSIQWITLLPNFDLYKIKKGHLKVVFFLQLTKVTCQLTPSLRLGGSAMFYTQFLFSYVSGLTA